MREQLYYILLRECGQLRRNPIYLFCMVVFPLLVVVFFTSLLSDGQPVEMPVGVVDEDCTQTSRQLVRRLDAFQTTRVAARYATEREARRAVQRGEIYAFLLIPRGTTEGMKSARRPHVSFYYSTVTLVAGSTLFRDLKTVTTLAAAGVGRAQLSALGRTDGEIQAYLQPVALDLHTVGNPQASYNVYITTFMVPGILMLFIFILTPYSIGTELKFGRAQEWMHLAVDNVWVALAGKLLPQTLWWLAVFYGFDAYVYGCLGFPHPGGVAPLLVGGLLAVVASQGFGVLIFGLVPTLRMSMSVCSLWSVLSFSLCGATFPVFAMDGAIQSIALLFPLRHYYLLCTDCVFRGYPLWAGTLQMVALLLFTLAPLAVGGRIRRELLTGVYVP